MTQPPPYHLRLNKAVDRLSLLQAIRHLGNYQKLSDYTYYGFGGQFLEDFRHLYELFPELGFVSIEKRIETLNRQRFHRPCSKIQLVGEHSSTFLSQFEGKDQKCIFWLDYTKLKYEYIGEFMTLLRKVADQSMVKITLRANPRDYVGLSGDGEESGTEGFRMEFGAVMPDSTARVPRSRRTFARLIQDMLRIAAQRALPAAVNSTFHPISSFYYSDGTNMLTLTGIVSRPSDESAIRVRFSGLEHTNFDWDNPRKIDVPVLSTKERLSLQDILPCSGEPADLLHEALGYLISNNERGTKEQLKQYAEFHRHYPYFVRAIP